MIYNVQLQNTTDAKRQSSRYLILPFVIVSKCLIKGPNSKLSLKVTSDKLKPGYKILVLHVMIQMNMKSNDFLHPEFAGRLSASDVESSLIYRVSKT